jgi:hypothetical protein
LNLVSPYHKVNAKDDVENHKRGVCSDQVASWLIRIA